MGYSTASAEDAAKKAATKLAVETRLGANRMVYSIKSWEKAQRASGEIGTGRTVRGRMRRRSHRPAAADTAGNSEMNISQLSHLGKRWLAGGKLAGLRAHNPAWGRLRHPSGHAVNINLPFCVKRNRYSRSPCSMISSPRFPRRAWLEIFSCPMGNAAPTTGFGRISFWVGCKFIYER